MVDSAKREESITLYGTHDPRRNFMPRGRRCRTRSPRWSSAEVEGTYTCQYPSDVTYTQIAKAACAAFGADNVVHFREDEPNIPDNVFEMNDALYRAIDWAPLVSIEARHEAVARATGRPRRCGRVRRSRMATVLVSGASGIVGYGILRSLRRALGWPAPDRHDDLRRLRCARVLRRLRLAVPTNDPGYLDWLTDTVTKHHVDLLMPGIEADVYEWIGHVPELEHVAGAGAAATSPN